MERYSLGMPPGQSSQPGRELPSTASWWWSRKEQFVYSSREVSQSLRERPYSVLILRLSPIPMLFRRVFNYAGLTKRFKGLQILPVGRRIEQLKLIYSRVPSQQSSEKAEESWICRAILRYKACRVLGVPEVSPMYTQDAMRVNRYCNNKPAYATFFARTHRKAPPSSGSTTTSS